MRLNLEDYSKLFVRPVVVVTTVSKNGVPNAAPFSMNTPLSLNLRCMGFRAIQGMIRGETSRIRRSLL